MGTPCFLKVVDLPDRSKAPAVPEEDAKVATPHGWKPRKVREVRERRWNQYGLFELGIALKKPYEQNVGIDVSEEPSK